jgi:hypothetical protein
MEPVTASATAGLLAARVAGDGVQQVTEKVTSALSPRSRVPSQAGESVRDILGQYDLNQITPREFSELVQRMSDSGNISTEQLQDLALIRLELDLGGVPADESIDLVQYVEQRFESKLAEANKAAGEENTNPLENKQLLGAQRRLELLQKFHAIHSGDDPGELDVVV